MASFCSFFLVFFNHDVDAGELFRFPENEKDYIRGKMDFRTEFPRIDLFFDAKKDDSSYYTVGFMGAGIFYIENIKLSFRLKAGG